MSSKTACFCVRAAVIVLALSGLIIFGLFIPAEGAFALEESPEEAVLIWSWLIFLWCVALPCFAVLVYAWKVSTAIKKEQVFTMRTAKWVKAAALLLFADVGLLAAGNLAFVILGMNAPAIVLMSFFIIILETTLATFAAVLSHYIAKAAAIREENEGTV